MESYFKLAFGGEELVQRRGTGAEELVQKASGRGTRNWCRGEDLDPANQVEPILAASPGGAYSGRSIY